MSRRRQQAIVAALEDHTQFAKAIEDSDKYLIVIDLHQDWCGPCIAMDPIYRKIYIDLDRAEDRVKFYTMDITKLTDEQKAELPLVDGCKPLFLVFKNKVMVSRLHGALAPDLEAAVHDNAPGVSEADE